MGKFTDKEKNIIREIVAADKFTDTLLAKLIDEYTSAIAIEWDNDYSKFRFIFHSLAVLDEAERIKKSDEHFKEIEELIILLRYLEDEKLIYLFENKDAIKDNCLYNLKKYIKKDDGTYCNDEGKIIINESIYQADGYFYQDITEMPYNVGKYVHHFAKSIFGISYTLRELVENDFESQEQLRHNKMLILTRIALFVALFGSIITATEAIIRWNTPKDNSVQNELLEIKQTINQKTLPEVIKTKITNDTLTTKVVEMPKVKPNR